MSPEMADIAIPAFLKCIRERLEQAASIAKAAEACAEAGNPEKGVEIVLDVEMLLYEATTLLNGASLINRYAKS
jgi:anthranilate phosphoribosyltransferase